MTALGPLRDVIKRYDLRAKKSLGQNFLLDLNLTDKIARAAGPLEDVTVIEIGPGPGGLTRAMLEAGAQHVIAIEQDERCLGALEEISSVYPGRLEVIFGDALALDLAALGDGPVKIVANLPYNIATALAIGWLTREPWPPFYQSMTLMFQREVAHRLTAMPRTKAYGRLSVLTQWRCEVEKMFDIDPRAFTPVPKVTSSVVTFTPIQNPLPAGPPGTLERVTKAAFGQRRKMLRASLKSLTADPIVLLELAGIKETSRAEELDISAFCRLANLFAQHS
jgi:16S rRNA (adenine1518-N6/adenine1519-N6)-dimethyltransferase